MFRNIISFKFVIILALLASMAGCNDDDEINALKKELSDTQQELELLEGRYNALCMDHADLKVKRRTLDTKLDDVDTSARTAEEQLQIAQQIIMELQYENEQLYATIENQQLILDQQEADLQELLNMLGITEDSQVTTSY